MAEYDFTKITQNIACKENINNYQLQCEYSTNKGDGYMGTVQAVRIVGTNKTLDLVYKYSHRDPKAHDILPLRLAYTTETYFYKVVIPAFMKFQEEQNIKNPFDNVAKYYANINEPLNELIVLENLKYDNFDLWDRNELMNRPHLECALRTFAKFHGTSLAMRHLQPAQFAKISTRLGTNIWRVFVDACDFYSQIGDMVDNILDIFDPATEKFYHEKMDYFRKNVEKIVDSAVNTHDEYDVVQQGDCWCNNVMYQYNDMNDRTTPSDSKLLDFQISRMGSPVFDLAYFFYTIVSKDCLDDLDHFLKLYHDAMAKHLKGFNLKIDTVFPHEKLVEKWKQNANFGLMMSFIQRKIMMIDAKDAPDLSDDLYNFMSTLRLTPEKEQMYRQQIKEIVTHFIDREFI